MAAIRIYKIEGTGDYAGGMVVVAASSAKEAARIGNAQSSKLWNVKFKVADAVELDTVKPTVKTPTLIAHFEFGE